MELFNISIGPIVTLAPSTGPQAEMTELLIKLER
jgi:hypothetical protein